MMFMTSSKTFGLQSTWSKSGVGDNVFIYGLKCKMCTRIEHREKLVIPKMDPMSKHTSERKRLPFMVWPLEIGSLQRLAWPMIVF